VLQNMVKMC